MLAVDPHFAARESPPRDAEKAESRQPSVASTCFGATPTLKRGDAALFPTWATNATEEIGLE